MSKNPRQPLVSIGAMNLWRLACEARDSVDQGDSEYCDQIRLLADKAQSIALRALNRKGINPITGLLEAAAAPSVKGEEENG